MLFFANRANLDKRRLLTRIHNWLQTQTGDDGPVEDVWYHPSKLNKSEVRATVDPAVFLQTTYPADEAQLQVSFDFPQDRESDYYRIQWVESERELMVGWHQDETHPDLGNCHFQIDHQGETIQQVGATFVDAHPLNVFDQRIDHLVVALDGLTWTDGVPALPGELVE
jgi:hypothetical protein